MGIESQGYRIVQTAARQSPGMEPFSSLAINYIILQNLRKSQFYVDLRPLRNNGGDIKE